MHTSWIGTRRIAVIPARPGFIPAPPNWADQIAQKLFYDPGPNGDDFSVRAYFETISYGKAQFEADIFPEAVVAGPTTCGNMQDEAIRTLPPAHGYERACVIFPTRTAAVGDDCSGWAFGFGSLFPGTSNLRGWCHLSMDTKTGTLLGTWGMELLHVFTYFGDLYFPVNRCQPTPGRFDEMDCACGTHPSAVTKLHMGWLTAAEVPVVSRQQNQYTLHALALRLPPPPGRVVGLRIPAVSDPSPSHYFLVECRLPVDRFDRASAGFSAGIPSSGVVVYEVNEQHPTGFWMCLRTPNALAAGQRYENAPENLAVEATAATWGGMRVIVRSTEPAECADLRAQIASLEEDRARAADDVGAAVGAAEREPALRELRRVEGELRAAQQRSRELACAPA